MQKLLLLIFLSAAALFGGTVRVMNDSPFPLQAEVVSADGQSKGKLSLRPQQMLTWQDSSSGTNVWSQTPYTVIFTCKDGKQFGVSSGVQQGATVMAMNSTGERYCQVDKKHKGKQEKNETEQNAPFNLPSSPFENDSPGSVGPADPSDSPGDPIWGPPST